jgi:tRNA pseudouridine55 synthase
VSRRGRRSTGPQTDGLVVVDKPAGMTSHDVVARLRRAYDQQRVGHAGTLDPDATGVLLVGLGRVTRVLRWLSEAGKSYRATVAFGTATSTLDAAGDVTGTADMADLTADRVEAALGAFRGPIEQIPPMVSAVQVGGRRLHELARAGEEVERAPRHVTIHRLELEAFAPGPAPTATLLVDCSSGTYVRTLADDLGRALGGFAHLAVLRRLRVGGFALDEAVPLDAVLADPAAAVLDPVQAVRDLHRVDVGEDLVRPIATGAVLAPGQLAPDQELSDDVPLAVVGPDGTLLAVYELADVPRHGWAAKPAAVLVDPPVRPTE